MESRPEPQVTGGRMDTRTLLLKLGLGLAVSLVSYLRLRPCRHLLPSPPDVGLKDVPHLLTTEVAPAETTHDICTTTTNVTELLPNKKSSKDEEGFHLLKDPETRPSRRELEMEQELMYLKNLVESLQERERALEVQMLEYHGLREQECAVKEFESQLKIMATEAKLFSLKMDTLQEENQRLRGQVSDCSRTTTELRSARNKIQLVKKKLRLVREQAKRETASFQQQIALLQEKESREIGYDALVGNKLKRLKELEDEAMDLRKLNLKLSQENWELKLKLESEIVEEVGSLREENDKLKKDIDQLHTDHCADVEELVYLRWINACLRYELRNYQPPPGKAVVRDLSNSLSPKSEQKAKQFILDYANVGINERNTSVIDLDSDYSSLHASTEDPDDTPVKISSTMKDSHSKESKFISKFKKLVLGKDHNRKKGSLVDRTHSSCCHSEIRGPVSPCSFEGTTGRGSSNNSSSWISVEPASGVGLCGNEQWLNGTAPLRTESLEIPRLMKLQLEET